MPNSKRLLVDFDRVVHKYSNGWVDGTIYDEPVKDAIVSIKTLQDHGFEVVIFTAKSELGAKRNQYIRDWLAIRGVKDIVVTNIKIPCLAIIDDRGIRFTNWSDMLRYFI